MTDGRKKDVNMASKTGASAKHAATEKQRALLLKLGVKFDPTSLTMGDASALIEEALATAPATEKQRAFLLKYGQIFDPKITKAAATALIGELIATRQVDHGLSLADVQSYDPRGGRGNRKEKRYCCPFCRKKISHEHRDFAVDSTSGKYYCHACNAKGILTEWRKSSDYQPVYRPMTKREHFRAVMETQSSVQFDTIPVERVAATLRHYENNAFIQFLLREFDRESVIRAIAAYRIGTMYEPSRGDRTVFWQIDKNGKVRSGKLMTYDPITGRRDKAKGSNWVHAIMKASGSLSDDFELEQCFFGEHLLPYDRRLVVAIVESEKSAVISSICLPQYRWLACGGKHNLQPEKLVQIGKRRIVLYPDAGGFAEWSELAASAREVGLDVRVFDLIERRATAEEKKADIDIADWLLAANRAKNANAEPVQARHQQTEIEEAVYVAVTSDSYLVPQEIWKLKW